VNVFQAFGLLSLLRSTYKTFRSRAAAVSLTQRLWAC